MARITIEDCLVKIPNKFELTVLAVQRVREVVSGAIPMIHSKDKEVVMVLREIAQGLASPDMLKESLIMKFRTRRKLEEDDPQPQTDGFSKESNWLSSDASSSVHIGDGDGALEESEEDGYSSNNRK